MGNLPPSIFIDRERPREPRWFNRGRIRVLLWLGFSSIGLFFLGRYYQTHYPPSVQSEIKQNPPAPVAPLPPPPPAKPERGTLYRAAANGDWTEVDRILKAGVSPDETLLGNSETPFHSALTQRYGTVALRLLLAGASLPPNSQDSSLMHEAAASGSPELLEKLVSLGYSLTQPDTHGITPLVRAALSGSAPTTEYLLQQKIDPNVTIPDTATETGIRGLSLLKAVILLESPLLNETSRMKMVQLLISHGMKFSTTLSPTGEKMMRAALIGPPTELQTLLERKSNPNLKDETGWTVLHAAVAMGNLEETRLLLKAGANPNLVDRSGINPPLLAEVRGFNEVLNLMGGPVNPSPPTP